MSKLRQQHYDFPEELTTPEEGDAGAYVVFTQLKNDGPFIYAGWLNACDDAMALQYSREHYGQDQPCTHMWVIPRAAIGGTEHMYPAGTERGESRPFEVFEQPDPGDAHVSTAPVEAESGHDALETATAAARTAGRTPSSVWVVAREQIIATEDDDVIWRYTDQSYRLARGYSKTVREKWETVREQRALEEYEKDDIKESF